eukprot:scaffold171497_cov33-Tisochrysis_lutea.AAC.1
MRGGRRRCGKTGGKDDGGREARGRQHTSIAIGVLGGLWSHVFSTQALPCHGEYARYCECAHDCDVSAPCALRLTPRMVAYCLLWAPL